jgi:hypothetical protein
MDTRALQHGIRMAICIRENVDAEKKPLEEKGRDVLNATQGFFLSMGSVYFFLSLQTVILVDM